MFAVFIAAQDSFQRYLKDKEKTRICNVLKIVSVHFLSQRRP